MLVVGWTNLRLGVNGPSKGERHRYHGRGGGVPHASHFVIVRGEETS